MSLPVLQSLCPFCGNPNHCGVSDIGGCWCGQIEIPMEMIDLLPEKGKSCICRGCVMIYQGDPSGFTWRHRREPI
ncbi:MAG: cysteine-rich CWC family protein [Verrucomicrobiota bacterium]